MFKGTNLTRLGLAMGLAVGLLARPAQADTITVTHWGGQFYGAPYAVAMDKGMWRCCMDDYWRSGSNHRGDRRWQFAPDSLRPR